MDQKDMMVQALSGGVPTLNDTPVQPQAQPGQGLSPEALAALFFVPRASNSAERPPSGTFVPTSPRWGESGIYDIMHDSGRRVGWAGLQYRPRMKDVEVTNTSAVQAAHNPIGIYNQVRGGKRYNSAPHVLGSAELATLGPEIRRVFPDAETISGYRVSGARDKVRKAMEVQRPLPPPPVIPENGPPIEKMVAAQVAKQYGGGTPIEKMIANKLANTGISTRGVLPSQTGGLSYGLPGLPGRLTDLW